MFRPVIAATLGDPRGIGPEVMRKALRSYLADSPSPPAVVVLGADDDAAAFEREGLATQAVGVFDGTLRSAGEVSLAAIRRAVELIEGGRAHALVTGPVHKPALRAAGADVPGQTELLRDLTASRSVGMLMHTASTRIAHEPLRILLATTHLPLRDVPARLSRPLLEAQIRLLDESLRAGWSIERPRIGLCGLNPHASDEGLFGSEEAQIMRPAVEALVAEGRAVEGPLSADTIFLRALDGHLDAVVAPYHDVGMAVFKTLSFGRGVNVTLGLPFPRTSPDHGTGFSLAGRDEADFGSCLEAFRLAEQLARARA